VQAYIAAMPVDVRFRGKSGQMSSWQEVHAFAQPLVIKSRAERAVHFEDCVDLFMTAVASHRATLGPVRACSGSRGDRYSIDPQRLPATVLRGLFAILCACTNTVQRTYADVR
jgi:hypothetical protein